MLRWQGVRRDIGGDPVTVELISAAGEREAVEVVDQEDGSYEVRFTPRLPGPHHLAIAVFARPIRHSPFSVEVTRHNAPLLTYPGPATPAQAPAAHTVIVSKRELLCCMFFLY